MSSTHSTVRASQPANIPGTSPRNDTRQSSVTLFCHIHVHCWRIDSAIKWPPCTHTSNTRQTHVHKTNSNTQRNPCITQNELTTLAALLATWHHTSQYSAWAPQAPHHSIGTSVPRSRSQIALRRHGPSRCCCRSTQTNSRHGTRVGFRTWMSRPWLVTHARLHMAHMTSGQRAGEDCEAHVDLKQLCGTPSAKVSEHPCKSKTVKWRIW